MHALAERVSGTIGCDHREKCVVLLREGIDSCARVVAGVDGGNRYLTSFIVGGAVVGGDPTGVYLQGVRQPTQAPYDQLSRQPADGSAPTILNSPPVAGAGTVNESDFDYLTGGFPWFATPQGYVHLWEFKDPTDTKDALWLQWSPLP